MLFRLLLQQMLLRVFLFFCNIVSCELQFHDSTNKYISGGGDYDKRNKIEGIIGKVLL